MKNKIFKILFLMIIIVITLFVVRHTIYNNIQDNWIIKISPNYLKQPPNTIYLYEDSYIITNCNAVNIWKNIVHKRGSLSSTINEDLITKIKQV
mgnify:CR=1 FL=1